jgi:uncharacterized membrane protein YccC
MPRLEQLKLKIDAFGANQKMVSNLALKKILINLRDLNERIKSISNYYNAKSDETLLENTISNTEYSKFVTHQDYAPHVFFDNFSFESTAFKHALRVALVCLFGFIIGKTVTLGHHSC